MVSIENLGNNIVQMENEMSVWWDTKVIEAKDELATLTDPVSLPKLVKSAPKTID